MKRPIDNVFFEQLLGRMIEKKNVFGAILCVESGNSRISYLGYVGNIEQNNKYFIASVTKLYITAIILVLRNQNKICFSDKVVSYFEKDMLDKIHVMDNTDYTKEITVEHLLSNTSGLPDYYYYEKEKNKAAEDILFGKDKSWSLDEVIKRVKELKPKFKPGQKGKVNYSDTNYQILGGVIENITGLDIEKVFEEFIFKPLDLKNTYAYSGEEDISLVPLYFKANKIHAPNYLKSITAEGGIVSTAKETMICLKAFFSGQLLPQSDIEELKKYWNMIYFPGQFYFGIGLEKLWVPRVMSPLNPIGEILGFWGQSGAFAFYNVDKDIYFTGTVNQLSGMAHSAAFKAIIDTIKRA